MDNGETATRKPVLSADPGTIRIPGAAGEFTAEWLDDALRRRHPGVRVTSVQVMEPDIGTSTRLRLAVTYADGEGSAGLPTRLFIKANFDNPFRDLLSLAGIYLAEVRFYTDILPGLDVPTPRCLFAEYHEDDSFVVVLEDIVDAQWGQWEEPIGVEHACSVLSAMAGYHARFWNSPELDRLDWLCSPVEGPQAATIELLSDSAIEQLATGSVHGTTVPEVLRDQERVDSALKTLLRYDAGEPRTLLHGDPHLKNLGFRSPAEPVFIDWQALRRGLWAHDVSYFLTTSLSVADRRRYERQLVDGYLRELAARQIEVSAEQAWLDYRAQPLYGLLVWLGTPVQMQPVEAVRTFSLRMLAAAHDLDTMGAIDELARREARA